MKPSSPLYVTVLIAVGLVVGRIIPPLAVRFDGFAPRPTWGAAGILAVGAAVVGLLAWNMWQAVHRDRRVISSPHAIRMLALAKAAIMVGGVFAGGYAGFALAYVGTTSELGRERLLHGGAAALAAVALLVAALVLERACRLPEDDGEDDHGVNAKNAGPSPA